MQRACGDPPCSSPSTQLWHSFPSPRPCSPPQAGRCSACGPEQGCHWPPRWSGPSSPSVPGGCWDVRPSTVSSAAAWRASTHCLLITVCPRFSSFVWSRSCPSSPSTTPPGSPGSGSATTCWAVRWDGAWQPRVRSPGGLRHQPVGPGRRRLRPGCSRGRRVLVGATAGHAPCGPLHREPPSCLTQPSVGCWIGPCPGWPDSLTDPW